MNDTEKLMDEIAYVCSITIAKDINKDSYSETLSEFSLDSLDYMDLLYNLEERFDTKIKLDPKAASKLSIASLAQIISKARAQEPKLTN